MKTIITVHQFAGLDFLLFNLIFTLHIYFEVELPDVRFVCSLTYKLLNLSVTLLNLNVRMLNLICKRYNKGLESSPLGLNTTSIFSKSDIKSDCQERVSLVLCFLVEGN